MSTRPAARTSKKSRRPTTVVIVGAQAERLAALARRWNVSPDEALRRALDQAFVGRGALVAAEAGFVFLEHLLRPKPLPPPTAEKLPEKK